MRFDVLDVVAERETIGRRPGEAGREIVGGVMVLLVPGVELRGDADGAGVYDSVRSDPGVAGHRRGRGRPVDGSARRAVDVGAVVALGEFQVLRIVLGLEGVRREQPVVLWRLPLEHAVERLAVLLPIEPAPADGVGYIHR